MKATKRSDAVEQGLRFYWAKVCSRHVKDAGRRYASSGACVGCARQYNRDRHKSIRARKGLPLRDKPGRPKGHRLFSATRAYVRTAKWPRKRPRLSEAHKAAIIRANLGRKHTPEERAKMSAYARNMRPEHRANLRAARKRRAIREAAQRASLLNRQRWQHAV